MDDTEDDHTARLPPPPSPAAALEAWAAAIRSKPDWTAKILDEGRALATKWVNEGDLGRFGVESDVVERAVRELKAEAARCQAFDSWWFISQPRPSVTEPLDAPPLDAQISVDVKKALGDVASFIQAPVLRDNCGVRTADGLVPESLHTLVRAPRLLGVVSELAQLQAQSPALDYHPGSDGKVLDIIHPSMYPYVAGETRLVSGSGPREDVFRTQTNLQLYSEYGDVPDPVPHSSKFAWIPSVFRVADDGQARIIGYVNNLGPRSHHPALYSALENVFTLALPLVEESLNTPFERVFTESYQRWQERHPVREGGVHPDAWKALKAEQKRKAGEGFYQRRLDEIQPQFEGSRPPVSLKGKDVKVIVKVAEYHLKPGQTYEGSWHIEGAPHEMIGSSLIYYYETSPEIKDKGLSLRRVRIEGDKPDDAEEHAGNDYDIYFRDETTDEDIYDEWEGQSLDGQDVPSDWGSDFSPYNYDGSVPLGTVGTTGGPNATQTGKMVAFPNWCQHKVVGLENTAPGVDQGGSDAVAKRKILCFFVVRDDRDIGNDDQITLPGLTFTGLAAIPPVATTLDIPPQQHHLAFPAAAFWLARACEARTGTALPHELCETIFRLAGTGFTRETAERYRREVMADRGVLVRKAGEAWEAEFGLCEH